MGLLAIIVPFSIIMALCVGDDGLLSEGQAEEFMETLSFDQEESLIRTCFAEVAQTGAISAGDLSSELQYLNYIAATNPVEWYDRRRDIMVRCLKGGTWYKEYWDWKDSQ